MHLSQISIHVSARETTGARWSYSAVMTDFNPRLRKGDDVKEDEETSDELYFNPRLRKGDDKNKL